MSESQLDQLLGEYREACGSPEAGRNFMPILWSSIEARQSKSRIFERVAKTMAGAAAALSLALGLLLAIPSQQPSAFFSSSYVEEIAADHAGEYGAFSPPIQLELVSAETHIR